MSVLEKLLSSNQKEDFKKLNEEITFNEYLEKVKENPALIRNSHQRMFDMISSYGRVEPQKGNKTPHHKFFDDVINPIKEKHGQDAIFGIDRSLNDIVNFFENAAKGLGAQKRILLLHGPVGSAKSSIARLLKKGIEQYSKTDEGMMFTYDWVSEKEDDILGGEKVFPSPMNEDPLKLLSETVRKEFLNSIDKEKLEATGYKNLTVRGNLNPACRFILKKYLERYEGDLEQVIKKHIRVKRLVLSEEDRIGIGTFQPKDEKNQDSTELTGDVNYRKIAEYGSDSDPRAFNFDGEFNVANRGIVEFVEMLKLDVAFLYDLLTASQEQCVKPKKFAQTDIDEVILGHTNEPEFRKLQGNEFMEALRDRTIKIDIPYITSLDDEIRVYKKDFTEEKVGLHIAPHTIEIASHFSIMSRLNEPTEADLDLEKKLRLYNNKKIEGYTVDSVAEMKKNATREGLQGISPRYVQDKISSAIIKGSKRGFIHPLAILKELEDGLKNHTLISNEDDKNRYQDILEQCRSILSNKLKKDVMKAVALDDATMKAMFDKYIGNVKAYVSKEKIVNDFSRQLEEPDEKLMRSIEERIDVPESRVDDFRREVMNYVAALSLEGKKFTYESYDKIHRALELKLFEDKKDHIKLNTLTTDIDKSTQEKIDVIKSNLIKNQGYNDASATLTLNYVSSLISKGESLED